VPRRRLWGQTQTEPGGSGLRPVSEPRTSSMARRMKACFVMKRFGAAGGDGLGVPYLMAAERVVHHRLAVLPQRDGRPERLAQDGTGEHVPGAFTTALSAGRLAREKARDRRNFVHARVSTSTGPSWSTLRCLGISSPMPGHAPWMRKGRACATSPPPRHGTVSVH